MRPTSIRVGSEVALVDERDYLLVADYTWHVHNGYACTVKKRRHVFMHRLLLQPQPKEIIDHINRNRLDNRRMNLRIVDRNTNLRNSNSMHNRETNPTVGVSYYPNYATTKPWRARYGRKTIGYFQTQKQAVKARLEYEGVL